MGGKWFLLDPGLKNTKGLLVVVFVVSMWLLLVVMFGAGCAKKQLTGAAWKQ